MTRWSGCSRAELDPTKLITFAQATRIWRSKRTSSSGSGEDPGSSRSRSPWAGASRWLNA
jgi:hypothetical protein